MGSTRPSSLPLGKEEGRTSLGLQQPTAPVGKGGFAQQPSALRGSRGSQLIAPPSTALCTDGEPAEGPL